MKKKHVNPITLEINERQKMIQEIRDEVGKQHKITESDIHMKKLEWNKNVMTAAF
tara:strand:+ start:118 stop:282 length:165 start_codon:yes stop_codon:yes gene_type:complete